MSKPQADRVRETHTRTVHGDLAEPVQMLSPGGSNPMLVRHIRVEFDTTDGHLRSVELVGKRLGPVIRYTARSDQMTRRIKPDQLDADHVPQVVRDFVEKHRPVVLARYLVTTKLPRNPDHDPKSKRTGACIASPHCTDVTGEHHTMLIEAADDTDILVQAGKLGLHITRIERVERLVGT
jgi:hypothetical protein